MRDLAVLFIHLIATFARLAGLGGARSVVAESVLVKQQLLILNRSRQRSPNLRVSDRAVAGLWAPDSSWPADPFRYGIETIYALDAPSSAEKPEISPTVLAQGTEEAGRQRTQPRSHCSGRPNETTESHLAVRGSLYLILTEITYGGKTFAIATQQFVAPPDTGATADINVGMRGKDIHYRCEGPPRFHSRDAGRNLIAL